jgi:1,2-diacylglycerol 3-beta-galactosyltransferase
MASDLGSTPAVQAGARTVLVLFADTGAGHRRAAEAVIEVLAATNPGPFPAVLCDPLTGPLAARPSRLLARLYGPAVRLAPWAWAAAYHVSNSRLAMAVLWRTAFRFANRVVAAQVEASRPAVIVSCHPLTGRAAVLAGARDSAARIPTVTVVTDLATTHTSWRYPLADWLTVCSPRALALCLSHGIPASRCAETGLPVAAGARAAPPSAAERAALRQSLGLRERDFVVLLAGGGEGCGGLAKRTAAILREVADVHVVTCCGRNERLRQRLAPVASMARGRLTVLGFVDSFADWIRCADVVVTKAGPGIIAEAACCGTPLLLTSHVPGQERGNAALAAQAGAGRRARGRRAMLRELARLREDPAALAAMRAGCRRLARPDAAEEVAAVIARLAWPQPLASGIRR